MDFKNFIENQQNEDTTETLKKLPAKFQKLIKGYKITFEPNNTLKGDKKHVGLIDDAKKSIVIAAPWNYSREWTFLHEIGHLVWKWYIDAKRRKEWHIIVKNTKNKQKQNDEELFCMAFSSAYAAHKVEIHNHPEWDKFIKSL